MFNKTTIVLLIVLLAVAYVLPMLGNVLGWEGYATSILNKIATSLLVITLAFIFLNVLDMWIRRRFKLSDDESRYFWSVSKYGVGALTVLLILFIFITDLTSLTLLTGLIGAGVAISLQHPLTAMLGWLFIVTTRAYRIGDRVFIGDAIGGVYGDIVDITLFSTKINDVEKDNWQETGGIVNIPNNMLLQKNLVNYTAESPFIWDEVDIPIKYGSNYKKAMELAEQAATKVVGEKMKDAAHFLSLRKYKLKIRDTESAPKAYISLRDRDVLLGVRYLVAARKKRKVNSEISRVILEIFEKNRICIAS
jgi:small-conductance mechanosensitive channel